MSYCLHPTCQKPENTAGARFCKACGRSLLLGNRYRALKLIHKNSRSRNFIAIDEHTPSKLQCVIEQFFLLGTQPGNNSSVQVAQKQIVEFFIQEATNREKLNKNAQIPKLLAFFPHEIYPCWVKEYVPGQTLEQIVKKTGPLRQNTIRSVLAEILTILEFTHSQNIIHGDINPEKIISRIPDGKFILTGLCSTNLAYKTAQFRPATPIGNPEYMPPEQARGQITFSADIYSLGITCIHLLTGIRPVKLYNPTKKTWTWQQHLKEKILPELGNLIDKMIKPVLGERYQNVIEVKKDFAKLPDILYESIDALDLEQKQFIVKQAIASALPGKDLLFRLDIDAMNSQEITAKIYETLRKYTALELEKPSVTEKEIFKVWQKHALKIIAEMEIPEQWEEKKERIITEIQSLSISKSSQQKSAKVSVIIKQILQILFETMNEKDKEKFAEKIVEEAEKQGIKITKNQLDAQKINDLLTGHKASETALEKILIQRLSQGFLIPTLATAIGIPQFRNWGVILAGPLGWGLVILAALGSGVSAIGKYRKERKKVIFIQTIFSIYSYSLANK